MSNARGKEIDNTHLSIDTAEERHLIHRDYIAHCLRWSHVAKLLGSAGRYRNARVLDIGCGVDVPLARTLYSNRFIVKDYVGLDYNPTHKLKTKMFEAGKFPLSVYGKVDFASDQVKMRVPEMGSASPQVLYVDGDEFEGEHELPDVITCFEMLEHVEPAHARRVLRKVKAIMVQAMTTNGVVPRFHMSTPCYDPAVGAADNHVSEIRRNALGAVLEDMGFYVESNFGTFGSIRDYRDRMLAAMPELQRSWDILSNYYDSNYLATIFVPMFPEFSRNNFWTLTATSSRVPRKFPPLSEVPEPWTSSEKWRELADDE